MSRKFCMNGGTFSPGNRKVRDVTWQFNPLLKRLVAVEVHALREKVPLENEEGLGFCKKDAYLSTLHPRLLTSSSLEVDLIRILQSLEAL